MTPSVGVVFTSCKDSVVLYCSTLGDAVEIFVAKVETSGNKVEDSGVEVLLSLVKVDISVGRVEISRAVVDSLVLVVVSASVIPGASVFGFLDPDSPPNSRLLTFPLFSKSITRAPLAPSLS